MSFFPFSSHAAAAAALILFSFSRSFSFFVFASAKSTESIAAICCRRSASFFSRISAPVSRPVATAFICATYCCALLPFLFFMPNVLSSTFLDTFS